MKPLAKRDVKDRIVKRLKNESYLDPVRMKIHRLRRAVLGDYSALEEEMGPQRDDTVRPDAAREQRIDEKFYTTLVRDFDLGAANEMLKVIRNMLIRTAFETPQIEFEDVEPLEAAVATTYLAKVLKRANASENMTMALADYLIGGYGFVWATIRDGEHVVRFIDSLDVIWDPSLDHFHNSQWFGLNVTLRLQEWLDHFGSWDGFSDLKDGAGHYDPDKPVRLIFYFDTYGDGTYACIRPSELDAESPKFIEGPGPNPHFVDEDGYARPILPIAPIAAMILPSTRHAVSVAEMMLPHQLQLRLADKAILEAAIRGKPGFKVKIDAVEEEALQDFMDGRTNGVLPVKSMDAVDRMEALDVAESVLVTRSHAQQQLVAMGGDNPYGSGKAVPGVQYAAEAIQIGNESSLVSGHVARVAARHWMDLAQIVLANAVHHTSPIRLHLDGLAIQFGPERPISEYLVADAKAIVSEDSLRYLSKQERMALALQVYETALSAAQIAPMSAKLAYERYLREAGVKNIAEHFESPAMGMQAGPAGMDMASEVSADMQ